MSLSSPPSLAERLEALERAVAVGPGRLPEAALEDAGALLSRARGRLVHGTEWTVVALAGATGSGKSSLFNAVAGHDLSRVSVQRPTTGVVHACVWGEASAETLLDWLGVTRIHRMGSEDPALDGLVLLDLPDHDSVELTHRLEMSRLVGLVDQLVWVLDPEKYADAALHDGFLKPLRHHADVMVFVLNQIDRLTDAELRRCMADLRQLLRADGLGEPPLVPASVVDGRGVEELRGRLADVVDRKQAAVRRIDGGLRELAGRLSREGGLAGDPPSVGRASRTRLTEILAEAAGVPTLTDAVAAGYRRDAHARVGWPVTRWLARLRAHPLRRLGLSPGRSAGATSLPRPGKAQRAVLRNGLRDVAEEASRGLSGPWPRRIRELVLDDLDRLVDPLDQAIATARLETGAAPRWWRAMGALQTLLLGAVVGGLVWLSVLFGFSYLRLPEPPTPEWRGFPLPTLMALGGVAGGLLTAMAGRGLARIGGRRRAARAETLLRKRVEEVAEQEVLRPLETELAVRAELAAALRLASGER